MFDTIINIDPQYASRILQAIAPQLSAYLKFIHQDMIKASYSLLGDLILTIPNEIVPLINQCMQSMFFVMEFAPLGHCTNVYWVLIQMMQQYKQQMIVFSENIIKIIINKMQKKDSNPKMSLRQSIFIVLMQHCELAPQIALPYTGFICSKILPPYVPNQINLNLFNPTVLCELICSQANQCGEALQNILGFFNMQFVQSNPHLQPLYQKVRQTLQSIFNGPQFEPIWNVYQ